MKSSVQSVAAIRLLLRQLGSELGQLNHRVGVRSGLKDGDLAVLDLLGRDGPMSPSALAKAAHVHPATMTGMLDRLESAGWVRREADTIDRRAVLVRALPVRGRDLLKLYAGMNSAIDEISESFSPAQRGVIAEFLSRVVAAGKTENDRLST
jgi:DNA-binding MarR family transcriptional regulator